MAGGLGDGVQELKEENGTVGRGCSGERMTEDWPWNLSGNDV